MDAVTASRYNDMHTFDEREETAMRRVVEFNAHKGGQGATVVAAMYALLTSENGQVHAHLLPADEHDPDLPAVLGMHCPSLAGHTEVRPGCTIGLDPPARTDVIVTDTIAERPRDLYGTLEVQRYEVIRNDFVALNRWINAVADKDVDGFVALLEPGRALGVDDMERTLGVPCVARLDVVPEIARAVDAGLLATRVPKVAAAAFRAFHALSTEGWVDA